MIDFPDIVFIADGTYAERPIMTSAFDRFARTAQRWAPVTFPSLFVLVFIMHFRSVSQFLTFEPRYVPKPAGEVVAGFIAANRSPILHDPHMIAYFAVPLILLSVFGLYRIGRETRPLASGVAMAVSVTGTVFLGGLFGTWVALSRGIGSVDVRYLDGATATFSALTAPHSAFLMTRSLAMLSMVGLGLQALLLLGTRGVPKWSALAVAFGSALVVRFWDLDNWMLIGTVLMLAGFVRICARHQPVGARCGDDRVRTWT
jgi:hypothetical protein